MNISLNWLKRYLHIDLPVEKISEMLTDIGLEVEGVDMVESIRGGLEGIVVGHVMECEQHPDADKLNLTKVNIGGDELLPIVCGAPNVAAGQKILVATIGTTLYDAEGEPWKIKKGKIRGEESHGMICAEDELGLGNDHDGIVVLPENVEVGTLASSYYNLENDYVFDIGLTPNRSDATHHLGVARDLGAYLRINEGWKGNVIDADITDFKVEVNDADSVVKVSVENEEACPRYSAIMLKGIKVMSSPEWMQTLLKAIGVRPINNVVDITNFVLHEMGQPLHAFDADKIKGKKIIVKNLPEGTTFISLDEQERKLSGDDLMICDGESSPLCMAGVFGGLNSGVTEDTKTIFLESAHFSAGAVRKTSTSHLLRTDAAKVFEKGSDPSITVIALKRAAMLLKEYANATICSQIIDEYPVEIAPIEIHLRYSHVNRLIGVDMQKDEIHNILRALNMELSPIDDNGIMVKVPTDKADVLREVDIIEEILRIYGFNKVEVPYQLKTAINSIHYPSKDHIKSTIADYLSSNGFNEMMGLSLVESRIYPDSDAFVTINNTSNIHLDIMRPDALISGLQSVAHNINHQQLDLRLFEFGRSYQKQEDNFKEDEFLSLFISGKAEPASWRSSGQREVEFFDIKSWVDNLLDRLNIKQYQTSESDSEEFDYGLKYHRGPNSMVEFGKVSKQKLKVVGISNQVFYALIDIKSVAKAAAKAKTIINDIPKFPGTDRDLAIIIDEKTKFEEIVSVVRKVEKKLITEINLFDIYRNVEQIGENKKSYAVRFIFQDESKTLKDKDVDKVMNNIIQQLESKIGAQIRS
jgi:phenylalanyl-tRNA synthetase beta chain